MKTKRRGFFTVAVCGIAAMLSFNVNARPEQKYKHPDLEDFISRMKKSGYSLSYRESCIAYWFYREGMNSNQDK